MSEPVKAALIVGASMVVLGFSIILAAWLWSYRTPFQTCIRVMTKELGTDLEAQRIELLCLNRQMRSSVPSSFMPSAPSEG